MLEGEMYTKNERKSRVVVEVGNTWGNTMVGNTVKHPV